MFCMIASWTMSNILYNMNMGLKRIFLQSVYIWLTKKNESNKTVCITDIKYCACVNDKIKMLVIENPFKHTFTHTKI